MTMMCVDIVLNAVLAQRGELVFFARPKKNNQEKGHPETCPAGALLLSIRRGVFRQFFHNKTENARLPCRARADLFSPDLRCLAASTGCVDPEPAEVLNAICPYCAAPRA